MSLIFLLLTLTVTPLRLLTGWNTLIGFRRSLGLFSFFYAYLHLAIYFVFDRELSAASMMGEILNAPVSPSRSGSPLADGATGVDFQQRHGHAAGSASLENVASAGLRGGWVGSTALLHASQVRCAATAGFRRCARRPDGRTIREALLRSTKSGKAVSTGNTLSGEPQVLDRRVTSRRVFNETPEVRTFRLVSPHGGPLPFDYLPGQYLNIQLNIDGRRVNRSYTIASSPMRGGYCELSIKREDAGLASSYLHRHLHEGDRLRISAGAGRFIFTGQESDSVVLIAGGVGITPLMSITRYLTDRAWAGEILPLIVARTENDLIFKDELDLLKKRFPNLRVWVTLTRIQPDDAWDGQRGRMSQDWLTQAVPDLPRRLSTSAARMP